MKKAIVISTALIVSVVICMATFSQQAKAPDPANVPIYQVDGRPVINAHIVVGEVSVPGGSILAEEFPITLRDAAAFTSASSYNCFASQLAGMSPSAGGTFKKIDGTHFVIRAPRNNVPWQQGFLCIGN
jgi:hypothetical protein